MKIIIIQAAGEHNGTTKHKRNDYLRECLSIQHAFKENGWEADVWGKRHKNFGEIPDFNSYDYLLTLENYEMSWLPDFSKITKPIKIQWIIDLHFQKVEVYGKITKQMDIVLHSTKSLMKRYENVYSDQIHLWFPNGFDDRYFKNRKLEKTKDFVFVGNICNRGVVLKKMLEKYRMEYFMITGEDMIEMINRTKVHFNKSISVDVNYRNFETIGCGTCLLTNYLPELEELGFKDGENCYMYKDNSEIPNKLLQIFRKEDWKRVGFNGKEFSKSHTYVKRVETLIYHLNKISFLK